MVILNFIVASGFKSEILVILTEQWPDFGCEGIKVQRAHQPTSQCQGSVNAIYQNKMYAIVLLVCGFSNLYGLVEGQQSCPCSAYEQWPDFGCEGIKVQRAHQPTSQCQGSVNAIYQNKMYAIVLLVCGFSNLYGLVEGQQSCPCSAYEQVESECELKINAAGGGTCQDNQVLFSFDEGQYTGDQSAWQYLISLQLPVLNRPEGCYQHYCTGVLIAKDVVITAAHCIDAILQPEEGDIKVPLQAVRAPSCRNMRGNESDIRNVVYSIKHPEWMTDRGINNTYNADIALLKLDKPLSGPIAQYATYTQAQFAELVEVNNQYYSAGYNKYLSDQANYTVSPLFENGVAIVGQMLCDYFTRTYGVQVSGEVYDNSTLICGYSQASFGCQLDSGTPLIQRKAGDGDDVLIGLAAYGERLRCETDDLHQAPVFYTKISAYSEWIKKTLGKLKTIKTDNFSAQQVMQQNIFYDPAAILLPRVPNPDQL
eukprot:TRINITY_DN2996_c0_g1_i3.p1 TRINITY_DN2996_c0_g1~~TRINITY_DN2996_c0_g1_i3.p1  ORF type:complete len:482 (+),score=53.64 TRINITY_DN2996_c0_g1_i3:124-1569(+)